MQVDTSQRHADTQTAASEIIRSYLQDNLEMLLGAMRLFVKRANLAGSKGVEFQAQELLGMVINIALEKADVFDGERPPKSWILGIAAKVTLQEQRRVFGRNRREVSVEDYAAEEGTLAWRSHVFAPGPEAGILAGASVEYILSLVSEEDRRVVELSIIQQMDSKAVALELGIEPGTARVRQYRALRRLRAALEAQQEREEKRS